MNEREIFLAAKAINDTSEREAYLESVLPDDPSAIRRIHNLIAADHDDSFMNMDTTEPLAATSDLQLIEQPGGTVGPYKLLEQIGEGGFGVVFMAEQIEPVRRTVALKVIKPGMDTRQVIARFEAERQALAIMEHPNIAKVLDAGTTESGRPYFVMELVKGIPITKFCDQRRLDMTARLKLFVSVCQAIQHAHSKGVIHRDIKPGNVLVAMYDDQPVPKVIDFGVAKATGQQLTEKTLHTGFGAVVGSLEYMSPEQASFNQLDIDTRSDVYSLGVLLYELLTGSPPLSLDELRRIGLLESLRMVRESEALRPSIKLGTSETLASLAANRRVEPARLRAIVKGDLDWIVMKALDKDRNRRYENVTGLSEEVTRFLHGEPVLAHPPSQIYLLKKLALRRWRTFATAAAVLILVATVGLLIFWNGYQRSQQFTKHSNRVVAATNEATLALTRAQNSPIGSQVEWVAARAAQKKLRELLDQRTASESATKQANEFLDDFERRQSARQLAEQVENVVMMSATHADLGSWQRMDRQFEELFRKQGLDFDQQTPAEFARRIRQHPSSTELSEALELWIGTRGQISSLGGRKATLELMQPMADAMYAADPDPVRTGIRRLIYEMKPYKKQDVDKIVEGVDLTQLSPRTLSWLSTVYFSAGSREKTDEILYFTANLHPNDFMVNFDFAYMLESQGRWELAIRYFLRCTALRPDVSGTWRALGNAYRNNKELVRSREALAQAVSRNEKHGPIHVDVAKTAMALKDYAAVERAARRAIELGYRTPQSYYYLGKSLMETKRFAEALVAFGQCEKLGKQPRQKAIPVDQLVAECKRLLNEQDNNQQNK